MGTVAYLVLVLASFATGLWGWWRVLRLRGRKLLVRHGAWYIAAVLVLALAAGLWLSLRASRTTATAVVYGLPLPVVAFVQNPAGQWEDFVSPLSFWLAAFNVVFWLSVPGPFLAFLLRRKGICKRPGQEPGGTTPAAG